jgi:hypothetical protein
MEYVLESEDTPTLAIFHATVVIILDAKLL